MNEPPQYFPDRVRLLVALATLAGLPLRVWPVGRLGLNQFDEGIYALVAHGITLTPGWVNVDPVVISYAPPGYPLLVALVAFFVGMSDQACLLASALMGTLTIPLAAGIAGEIFGRRAAVTTAWLVCFSGPHIAFSRMGLTDATFLCFWSLAWLACHRFLRSPGFGNAVLMGGLVGWSQEVKYNGWLIGGFALVTAGVGLIVVQENRAIRRLGGLAGWGSLAIVVAWLVVLPWYLFVESHGGYAGLLRHQRSYLGGLAGWWPHLWLQVHQASVLSGSAGFQAVTVGVILWSGWVIQPGPLALDWRTGVRLVGLGGCLAPLIANPVAAGLIGLTILDARTRLADRLLGVIWVGLFFLTPFYHPYARLWLPFELTHWVLLGGLATRFQDEFASMADPRHSSLARRLRIGAAGVVLLGTLWRGTGFPVGPTSTLSHDGLFAPSDGLGIVAAQVSAQLGPEVRELRTFVRPSLSYSLRGPYQVNPQRNLSEFERVADPQTWGLVDSTLISPELTTTGDPNLRRLIAQIQAQWEVVAEFWAITSLPTALDLDPARRDGSVAHSMACFWLIRPRRELDNP